METWDWVVPGCGVVAPSDQHPARIVQIWVTSSMGA